ncbi:ComF family protein [Sporosalibacterium faouarense]|uniref:ComF family protein n=1 Tax=Sporosalibacterium faouarense TaxID=516123 RepID=UPI00192AEDE8|nr:ComF family protein [Sporosalibacterium faouarense]
MDYEEGLLKRIVSVILDLIYPEEKVCFICEEYDDRVEDDYICPQCRAKMVFIEGKICRKCGKPLSSESMTDKCSDCIKHPHYFERAISALEYEGLIKEAIYKYKYGKKPYMYKAFGALMVQALKNIKVDIREFDYIVSVPLHKTKINKRGFNQAELLGKYISDKYNIPLISNNLIRIKKTPTQNKLNRLERLKNIKGAFKVINKEVFINKKILLIDDIFTTGSTCDQCSRELLNSGAKSIFVFCLATGQTSK